MQSNLKIKKLVVLIKLWSSKKEQNKQIFVL